MSCPKSKNQSYLQKNNGKNEVGQPDTPKKNYMLKDPPGPSSKRSKNDVIKRNATAKEIGKNIRSSSNEKRYSDKSKATKGKKLPSQVGKATGTFKYLDDIEQNGDEIGGTHEEMRVAPSETHHGDYNDGGNEAQDQNEQKFTDEQKELVVVLVEKYPALWDMCSQFYHHGDVQKNCWKAISKDSGFTIEQCKRMWRSAKDGVSSRKNKVKAKSGDPATDPADEIDDSPSQNLDQENEECGWLLWEPMKFFRERKGSVITRSSMPSNKGKVRQTSFDTPTNSGDFSNTFVQEDAREIEIGVELGGSRRNSIYNYVRYHSDSV